MIVIVMDNASEKLRGELTKWLLEVKPGVLVGKTSALVREKLWEKVENDESRSGALLIYNSDNEQGFAIKMVGILRRSVIDLDGIQLIKRA
ncbi:MAG: type I-E CRISPR-associated endoribonuclease Cas2e [Lachnospiraceae bacterium]|nr:type I-E CRISPR-associated endoribonuclease Cas2e [Lachnospiraceae bacterium]